jgi:methyl-accepting chemotaxis protein
MERFVERRRNYYIKKEFQRNFILKFCALVAVGSLISGLIIYAMSRATLTTTFENSRLAIKSTADFILPAVLLSSALVIILIGIATTIVALFTSHKIAGPLYRMDKDVQEVATGNLKMRFNLRAGDELKALAVSLDIMAHNLREAIGGIKSSVGELESLMKQAETDKNDRLASEIKNRLKQLKEAVERFKT